MAEHGSCEGDASNVFPLSLTFGNAINMYACTYSVYTLVACDCMTDEKPLCESLWKKDGETERARGRFDEVEGVYLACTCSLWLSSHRGDREAVAPRRRSWPQIHHTHQLEKIISHSDSQAQHFSSTSRSGSAVLLKSLYWNVGK